MKKIAPITAFAIVKKDKMKLNAYDIFPDKDVKVEKDEILLKVKIMPEGK